MIKLGSLWKVFDRRSFVTSVPDRRYRLINLITIQLILLAPVLITYVYVLKFWLISIVLIIGMIVGLVNLVLLRTIGNINFSGHLLVLLVLTITTLVDYMVGGISVSYFSWYLTVPLLAGAIIGVNGVFLYASISLILILAFSFFDPITMYQIQASYLPWVIVFNNLFSLVMISTLLCNILYENVQFSIAIKEQNWLLQKEQQKILYLSRHDGLTKLANRAYFYTFFKGVLETTNTQTYSITLFFLNLNQFKYINETYGYKVGEKILIQISKRLKKCLRKSDFIARLAEDEFAAVLVHANDDKISDVLAERILQELEKPFMVSKTEIICLFKLGRSCFPRDATSIKELINIADQPMYSSKMRGREDNGISFSV